MDQFHIQIKEPEYSHRYLGWGYNDYYIFRELMNVLGIGIYDYDGNYDCNDSGLLWFDKEEWGNAISRLKNYDNESQDFKDSILPFFNRDAMISSGIYMVYGNDKEPWDEIPTLEEIIEYMEYAYDHTSEYSMIHLAWW